MRTFTVTVGYNVCYVNEVTVRAAALAQACEKAIALANRTAEGWRATDGASDTYVEVIETAGEAVVVPETFTEVGILTPEVAIMRRALARIVRLGSENLPEIDAPDTVRAMVVAAQDSLREALQRAHAEPACAPGPSRCETCGGRGRLENPGDYLGTETCLTCAGTGRVT